MSTPESSVADADARIAMEYLAKGLPIPPEVALRIRSRAEEARKQLLKTHGIQNSGVQIIRELRGELPNP